MPNFRYLPLCRICSPGQAGRLPRRCHNGWVQPPVPAPAPSHGLLRFVARAVATAIGLWVATALPGISVTGGTWWTSLLTLLAVAVIFGLVNAVIKPIIKVLGCLFYLATLGLIAFVVNALLFLLVGKLASSLNLPFTVQGFWSALWGAIIVSVVSWVVGIWFRDDKPRVQVIRTQLPPR